MDPPTSMGGGDRVPSLSGSTSVGAVDNGNNGTGGKEHDNEEIGGKKRLRADPPESREQCNGGIYNIHLDDQLDEYEIEGLLMTSNVGSDSGRRNKSMASTSLSIPSNADIHRYFIQHCSPLLAICSIAFEQRNRTKSTIILLFVAFISMILLTENDISAWHKSMFVSKTTNRKSSKKNNPLSKLTSNQRTTLLKQIYGSWTFFDGGAEDRPKVPYMTIENAGNPYLDLPEDKFPEESWQTDAVYANHFLDASEKLVKRGQQAIFTSFHGYGLSNVHTVKNANKRDDDTTTAADDYTVEYTMEDADARSSLRRTMFHIEEIDLDTVKSVTELQSIAPSWDKQGGWTTQRSFDGLERRITHAIMTESNFTVVITGSWQSMGYGGCHSWQSMGGVFESLLTGVFEKMGVKLVVRAIGLPPLEDVSLDDQMKILNGGKSTLLHTLGWSSIYGSDVDMVIWDDYSPIHNNDEGDSTHELDELSKQLFDLFARQALLSGTTNLPFIWGGDFEVLRNLHQYADADVGQLGNGLMGVEETTSLKVASTLPWAAQYVNCPGNMQTTCSKDEYQFESKCWVERSDVAPPTTQLDHIPILPTAVGWRMQHLKAYTAAYVFLAATLDALQKFSEITISQGFPLADEHWHMGNRIKNVQEKVKALDEAAAPHCFQLHDKIGLPKRLCRHTLKGKTEYTPRSNPKKTSIRSILDTAHDIATLELLYEGDDAENPMRTVPKGEVDTLELLDLQGKRRRMISTHEVEQKHDDSFNITTNTQYSRRRRRIEGITSGKGWKLLHSYGDDCDGSLYSSNTCGRIPSNNCLLEGHQGSRGIISGNEGTGWLKLLPIKIKNGYIAMNLEVGDHLPDSFVFEYAINGDITTLEKSQFVEKLKHPVPGASLLTVYDDDEKVSEGKDVAIAIRAKGCTGEVDDCKFALTHVYWS